tara:strand:+ start:193 stop:306 length:114 start_codon:yes stop_codon:yes gene_type:complete
MGLDKNLTFHGLATMAPNIRNSVEIMRHIRAYAEASF